MVAVLSIVGSWDHTNPPHPHHYPFNKFELGFIKCKDLLNTHKTELVRCNLDLLNCFKYDVWGWGGVCVVPRLLCRPPRAQAARDPVKGVGSAIVYVKDNGTHGSALFSRSLLLGFGVSSWELVDLIC